MRLLMTAAAVMAALLAMGFAPSTQQPPTTSVMVERDGARWTADFTLDRNAPVWAFHRSALEAGSRQPWRLAQWTVETPGVVLERRGNVDVLRAVGGGPVPRRVRIAMRPAQADLEADYDPVLMFTDGSVAMFAGHFDLVMLDSVATAEALPVDLNETRLPVVSPAITWRDRAGPVLIKGERRIDAVSADNGLYVLFGQVALTETPDLAMVLDPQAPPWIGAEIGAFAPTVAGYYTRRLGPGEGGKPTVMISWNGATPGVVSMGGSVLSGLIVMTFEGEGVVTRTAPLADGARWFIGHESAHFWLNQTVRYEFARDAWITEGGSDLMAIRALAAIDPAYDARARLQESVDECVGLADEPVSEGNVRGEHRAYYACGAVFGMVAEGVQRRATGGDWFDFLKPVIDASREDGVLTRDEWLDALNAVSGDATLRRDIEMLLDQGSPQAGEVVATLFDRSGIAYSRDGDKVRLN